MASTPLAARIPEIANASPAFINRLLIFLVGRRVLISMVLFASVALYEVLVGTQPRNVLAGTDPLAMLSIGLILAGLLIRSWAAGTLRKYKRLVTEGPYALVRNPLYFGSFLMIAGFCMLLGDLHALWIVGLPVVLLYWLAIRDEEQLLNHLFPEEWPTYAARTPRLVPWRWKGLSMTGWSLHQWRKNHEFNAWLGSALALGGLRLWWVLAG